jgi:hypothetical protein
MGETQSDSPPQPSEITTTPVNEPDRARKDFCTPKRHGVSYLRRVAKRITLHDWDQVVVKALQEAKEGDYRARQWLTDLVLQIPPKAGKSGSAPVRAARELVDRIVTERVVQTKT